MRATAYPFIERWLDKRKLTVKRGRIWVEQTMMTARRGTDYTSTTRLPAGP
jgi:hypothetical protein